MCQFALLIIILLFKFCFIITTKRRKLKSQRLLLLLQVGQTESLPLLNIHVDKKNAEKYLPYSPLKLY